MGTMRAFGEDGVQIGRVTFGAQPSGPPFVMCPLALATANAAPISAVFDIYRIAYERAQAEVRPTAYELARWVSLN